MNDLIKEFTSDEAGATSIEYGLIASLIAIAIITTASKLGSNVSTTFNRVATTMTK